MVKRIRLVLFALLMLGVAACGSTAVRDTVPALEAADVLGSNPDAVLLDIRTPEEFADGRIAGSVNIDFYAPDFRDRISALERSATYVVYCRSGNRSDSAMDIFDELCDLEPEVAIDGWSTAAATTTGCGVRSSGCSSTTPAPEPSTSESEPGPTCWSKRWRMTRCRASEALKKSPLRPPQTADAAVPGMRLSEPTLHAWSPDPLRASLRHLPAIK